MLDLNNIAKNLKAIPPKEQKAIVNLIQLKTEADMDRVLNKLDSMEAKLDAKLEAFDVKLEAMENKFDAKLETFDAKLEAMDSKFEARLEAMRWLLMAIIAIIPIAFTVFGYLQK
ncbi:hypothetical protein A6A19_07865 [Actinobacillus delphinicola]|uniref:Uncharacterized protein n=1 Tax=Actinobacillus delphinicola TaxID=51161 RepID=A0A448TU70_9PAST|nr:hypothetical protein [Actinobacillus delphinicola]MDG6897890.1 hypothetical protein [Actinobacillus delphinicola]VEJ09403.1 Uncharacterised protein [Actinobacillus delphinicola]